MPYIYLAEAYLPPHLEPNIFQEPPWLWFTLPELGFPLLMDEFLRPIHPEIEEYMRRHVSNNQDWEQVDDEDCWGVNYMEPTPQIRDKMTAILHTWGEEQPEIAQVVNIKPSPERSFPRKNADRLKTFCIRLGSAAT